MQKFHSDFCILTSELEGSMALMRRRSFLLGLCGAAICAGCNFPTAMYFLMPEAREPAEYKKLASDDKKKEVKVVLWAYSQLDVRTELIQADRQLTDVLAKQLRTTSEENQEKVTIVSPRKVEEYKNTHPNWKSLDPLEIGRYFKADYVVSLEIDEFSLYAPNAQRMMYQGRIHILVSLADVNNPDESLSPHEFSDHFPSEARGGIDSLDMPVGMFRQQFLAHVAKQLSFLFVPHQKRDRVMLME
jgi:hypothetical protein